MFELFKDGANKLKAKIGGDQLDEKLVEVVSEENWQASTQQLHEVASAAYNYEKWQRINEFIWDKLKKSKSWKKILKTFNLIQFLLKNGPPSIISNFKYDLYQLRTFQSYSSYIDGLDKGEPIRERAKVVVNLLGNQELLEEERVKAKNIREKMANVVGGSSYSGGSGYGGSGYGGTGSGSGSGYGGSGYGGSGSGYGGSGYGGNSKYDNEPAKKKQNKAYDYGNGLGTYGDYNYNKSTLDKYKDPKNDKSTTNDKKQEKKPEIAVETKKPFQKIASKLSKPGQKKQEKIEQVKQNTVITSPNTNKTPQTTNNNPIIDIFQFSTPPTTTVQPVSQPFSFDTNPAPPQVVQPPPQPVQQLQPTQPFQQVQPVTQPTLPVQGYPQQPNPQFQQLYPQQPPLVQQYPLQQPLGFNQYGQPVNQYPQAPFNPQPQYNQYAPQPQFGYQQPYNQLPPQQQYNPYSQPNPIQAPNPNPYQQQPPANYNLGITLNTQPAKKQEPFKNQASTSTAQNVPFQVSQVNWLSSTEKGLLDFSDFSSEVKKDSSKQITKKPQINNNIQIDNWNW